MLKTKIRFFAFLFLSGCAVTFIMVWFGNSLFIAFESDAPSRSVGSTDSGRLENGKRLPTSGVNFRAYSRIGTLLGRNSVHGLVRTVILEAYATLAETAPDLTFVYAEASWPSGGPMPPHRTHMNGLSVDFMVPVRDGQGNSVPLPTLPLTFFFWHLLDFDAKGRLGDLQIDFEAIAKHLDALQHTARTHGIRIDLVVLTPEYLPLLWQTPTGRSLQNKFIPFYREPAKTRHDDHYHVNFSNPVNKLSH